MGGFGDIYTKAKSSLLINFMQIVDFFRVCDIMYTYGNVGLFTCGGNMKYKVIGWTNNDDERYPATELDCDEKYDAIVGGKAVVDEYGTPEMLGWTAGVFQVLYNDYLNK